MERKPTERFIQRFEDDLRKYAVRIGLVDYDRLVAISRKGPRLLQLISAQPQLPDLDLSRCVTEKALPFLNRECFEGREVLLTDDTVIWGSTFAGVRRRLEERGASVHCLVLGASDKADATVREQVEAIRDIPAANMCNFIDLQVQAFAGLAMPYDIDHPMIRVALSEDWHSLDLAQSGFAERVDATTQRWQRAHGVEALSFTPRRSVTGKHSLGHKQYGPAKVRVFVRKDGGHGSVEAMYCLALSDSDLADSRLFDGSPEPMGEMWNRALETAGGASVTDEERLEGLSVAAHFLASAELLAAWLSEYRSLLAGPHKVSPTDLRLLFGESIGGAWESGLSHALDQDVRKPARRRAPTGRRRLRKPNPCSDVAALAASDEGSDFLAMAGRYMSFAHRRAHREGLAAILEAQRLVWDERTRRAGAVSADRLATGLPFPAYKLLLALHGHSMSDVDFSVLCDVAVDAGCIVPRYGRSFGCPDRWVRTARFGENLPKDAKGKYWLNHVVREACRAFRRFHPNTQTDCVPWYPLEKLLVTLYQARDMRLSDELDVSVSVGYDRFGARLVLGEIPSRPFLVNWALDSEVLQHKDNVRVQRASGVETSGRVIMCNPSFESLYSDERNPLDAGLLDRTTAIVQAFLAIDAVETKIRKELVIHAITSCASENAYLSAITRDIEEWLLHPRFNASRISSRLARMAAQSSGVDMGEGLGELRKILEKSAQAIAQVEVKRSAFEARLDVRAEIDELAATGGPLDDIGGVWSNSIRSSIDHQDPCHDGRDRHLRLAAYLAKKVLSVVRTALQGCRLAAHESENPVGRELGDHVSRFNEAISRARSKTTSRLPEEADSSALGAGPVNSRLEYAAALFEDTRSAVYDLWSKWHHPSGGGDLEPHARDAAILLWDIIGSAKKTDSRQLQESIDSVNRRIMEDIPRRRCLSFQPDLDDGNALVCPSVGDTLEWFRTLAEYFDDLGLSIKAGIETTVDGEKLWKTKSGEAFGGKAFQIAARLMALFKDVKAQDPAPALLDSMGRSLNWDSPVGGSYVVLSDRAVNALSVLEGTTRPEGLQVYGTCEGYRIRDVASALPTVARVFLWHAPADDQETTEAVSGSTSKLDP